MLSIEKAGALSQIVVIKIPFQEPVDELKHKPNCKTVQAKDRKQHEESRAVHHAVISCCSGHDGGDIQIAGVLC